MTTQRDNYSSLITLRHTSPWEPDLVYTSTRCVLDGVGCYRVACLKQGNALWVYYFTVNEFRAFREHLCLA